jgi:hypothetical protein
MSAAVMLERGAGRLRQKWRCSGKKRQNAVQNFKNISNCAIVLFLKIPTQGKGWFNIYNVEVKPINSA